MGKRKRQKESKRTSAEFIHRKRKKGLGPFKPNVDKRRYCPKKPGRKAIIHHRIFRTRKRGKKTPFASLTAKKKGGIRPWRERKGGAADASRRKKKKKFNDFIFAWPISFAEAI